MLTGGIKSFIKLVESVVGVRTLTLETEQFWLTSGSSAAWTCCGGTSLHFSFLRNTRTLQLLLFHYSLIHIVMLAKVCLVPLTGENERCHFPLLSLSLNINLKCLISFCMFNSLIASAQKKKRPNGRNPLSL